MMDNNTYYGITIGPIFDTMSLTSTPGGLWTASYLFSYITKSLVKELKEKNLEIIIPYYENDNSIEEVGSYPDHIIFKGNISSEDINKIVDKTKENISEIVKNSLEIKNSENIKSFFNNYLSIRCIKIDSVVDDVMGEINQALDNVEASKQYIFKSENDYLLDLFCGEDNQKNLYLHKFFNNKKFNISPQVVKANNKIQTIDEIAKINNKTDYKISKYFAIGYVDGDNMSSCFKIMGNNLDLLNEFSKACVNYTKECANIIKAYGGVTIYAGGDDLLFIVPLLNKSDTSKSIFNLCQEIKESFEKNVKGLVVKDSSNNEIRIADKATISFGISINYHRFPLYEAFEKARELLFLHAKNFHKKNNLALSLTKSSGTVMTFNFNNESETLSKFIDILNTYFINANNEKALQRVSSINYLVDNYKDLFELAVNTDASNIYNFFINMYDNPNQEDFKTFVKEIIDLYIKLISDQNNNLFKVIQDEQEDTKFSGLLRLAKFFIEKRGDKNA